MWFWEDCRFVLRISEHDNALDWRCGRQLLDFVFRPILVLGDGGVINQEMYPGHRPRIQVHQIKVRQRDNGPITRFGLQVAHGKAHAQAIA